MFLSVKLSAVHNIIQRLRDAGEICALDGLDVVCLWDCFNNTHNSHANQRIVSRTQTQISVPTINAG